MNDSGNSTGTSWQPITSVTDEFRRIALEMLRLSEPETYLQLKEHEPDLARIEVQPLSANHILARIDRGAPWELIPPPPVIDAFAAKVNETLRAKPRLLILAGPGFGAELNAVYLALCRSPETIAVIIEPDPLALLLALTTHYQGNILQTGAVIWAVGEPVEETLLKVMRRHALFLLENTELVLIFGRNIPSAEMRQRIVNAVQTMASQLKQQREEARQSLLQHVAARKTRPAKPIHVWSSGMLQDYTATPILKAFHRGFNALGVAATFTELPLGQTRKYVHSWGRIQADPDTILTINDPTGIQVPEGEYHRLVWISEDPAFRTRYDSSPNFSDDEIILYADRAFERELAAQGVKQRLFLPAFAVLEREGIFRPELAHPLVFVGAINNFGPVLETLPAAERDRLETVYSAMVQEGTGTVGAVRLWRECEPSSLLIETARSLCAERFGRHFADDSVTLAYLTYALFVYRRRLEIAQRLLPLGLHIYGSHDWAEILGSRYADRYHGVVLYDELPDIYRSATITINIHSAQCPTCLNIRDFDILRAGGCMLTDPVADMGPETLEPEKHCKTATTPEAFVEAAQRLLDDRNSRESLAQTGQTIVLKKHLPIHRVSIMMELFD